MKYVPKFLDHAWDKCYTYCLIWSSGLFDAKWYQAEYPEVKESGRSPLAHYLKLGYRMGYDPSERFSAQRYESDYPEVHEQELNPLVHYLKKGRRMGYKHFPHMSDDEVVNEWFEQAHPLVTVIVPNYNHAPYLRKRLDSIYSQTYGNYEVILMDDKSSDNSTDILKEYQQQHPDNTRLLINEQNSGSPFYQWEKGIQQAKGDYIWIAESDDWCDKDFLRKLLPSFSDESVMLAFSRTVFMTDGVASWDIISYLQDIAPDVFNHPFTMSAHECVKRYFSKKNIIPNVSSCIFRHPGQLSLLNDNEWKTMKVCGDWIFYLHLIRGGFIAYNTRTTNYYRQHSGNTSVGLQEKDRYYQEHQTVRKHLASLYALSSEELEWMVGNLRDFWKSRRNDFSEEYFEQMFPSAEIEEIRHKRLPNVAICSFAFSTGGGEKVPIDQANALHDAGVGITFINYDGAPRNELIRKKLNAGIPVINLKWNFTIIRDLLTQLGTEFVHSHHTQVDVAIANNKPANVKHIVTLHGMYEAIKFKYIKDDLPLLFADVDKWLYIADKNLPVLLDNGADKTRFHKIFNAVPPTPAKRSRQEVLKECGFPENAFICALASRAIEEKGWQYAADSIGRLREATGRDLRIVFVGDGPVYEQKHEHPEPWSYYAGYSEDVASYFNAADLVLLPSVYFGESFPLCILEAFNAGRPVVATAIGEVSNMMTTEVGIAGHIVPQTDFAFKPEDLDAAILAMADKGAAYEQAIEAAHVAAEKFSMENLTRLLISYYA